MTFVAILILAVKLPIIAVMYLFRHRILLVALVAGVVFIFVARSCGGSGDETSTINVPEYQKNAPSVEKAPYVVSTRSRMYYVEEYNEEGDMVTLVKYYIYNDKKWDFSKTPLPLDRKTYGEIRIYRRSD